MELSLNSQNFLSKIATNDGHGENSPYFDGWKAYDSNPFHPINNPDGVIQMGLAENQAVANFMGRVRGHKATFDPDHIVMSGGATGAAETISFCLADPGDGFLVPSPYYPAFDRDIRWRTGTKLVPIICESSNNFILTLSALETAYNRAQEEGIKVKGLLINNPSNPLGTTLDRKTLTTIVQFTNEKNIHLVCDEIYAATVFSQPDFVSISEILEEEVNCNKNLVHILYSLSKDMGLPGFRVGIIYSYNKQVVSCARKMSSFGLVSTQTQHLIASMLSDNDFVERFIEESARRLATRHNVITNGLSQVGIGSLKSNAGLFLWMDLRRLMKESTEEAEMNLWRAIINEVKLNVSPGSAFHCSEPGWFRVCFANMDDETVGVALKRIRAFVLQNIEVEVPIKKHRWSNNLRLSFSSLKCEDATMTPPHSPLPHSPLVRAV
ncbi:hypothetical protein IFM89_029868 [Coptis chinensis]|uniref:1-aminocyclopropane-1-carboxylate synthase n=1 Tax=Coptis chinensis TaxID=261450 RepID=A0A835HQ68_9MAGN|nr:hypothetical protein IFM89_029868 [Coptis chinensis]